MTYFHRAGGGMAPSAPLPLDPLLMGSSTEVFLFAVIQFWHRCQNDLLGIQSVSKSTVSQVAMFTNTKCKHPLNTVGLSMDDVLYLNLNPIFQSQSEFIFKHASIGNRTLVLAFQSSVRTDGPPRLFSHNPIIPITGFDLKWISLT